MLQDQVKTGAAAKAPVSVAKAFEGVILVHIPTEGEPESFRLALTLAEASGAAITAVVAEGFQPAVFGGAEFTSGSLMQALLDAQRRRIAGATAKAAALKTAAKAPVAILVEELFPEEALAAHACGADWIVQVRPQQGGAHAIYADPSAVLLRAGMPTLLAPREAAPLCARRIVVAWRDSREARRAVSAAMPLLAAAEEVLVLAVSAGSEVDADLASLEQVVSRLKRRGCQARCELHQSDGRHDVASILEKRAAEIGADLIVAGAYAHSRAGEWVFGGVTRTLIDGCAQYLLLAH